MHPGEHVSTSTKTHIGHFEETSKNIGKTLTVLIAGYLLNKFNLFSLELTFERAVLSFLGVAISIVGLYIWQLGKDIKDMREQLNRLEERIIDD